MSIVELLNRAEENRRWLDQNYKQLTERYRDKWVAVLEKSVVDYDTDLKRLTVRVRKKLDKRYSEVAIEYVTEKPINMVLVI